MMMKNKQKIVDGLRELSAKRADGKRELSFEQIVNVIEKNTDIPKDKIKMVLVLALVSLRMMNDGFN